MPQTASKKNENYSNSWYSVTPNRLLVTLGPLRGEINCDVCVIGGGFTGLSAAYELAQRGYSVTLLEANEIMDSSPSKEGGHLLRGYYHSPEHLAHKYTAARARMLCNMTLEGLGLIVERIAKHEIKCDLKFGHVTAALTYYQEENLKRRVDEWARFGHTDLKFLDADEVYEQVESERYLSGLYDPKGAHFHPLNYALGVAQAAQQARCRIYDNTRVVAIKHGPQPRVETSGGGAVNAKFVILSGYIRIPGVPALNRKIIPVPMQMVATAPLSERIFHKIIPKSSAIVEASHLMNCFKLSHDGRLLFGSLGLKTGDTMREHIADVFPSLAQVRFEHRWSSMVDFTLNHMPCFGRESDNVFYAHGYCGQGIILGNLAGKLMAEAVAGTAERFDVFSRIKHLSIPGGNRFKQRILNLGLAWYKMQDSLF